MSYDSNGNINEGLSNVHITGTEVKLDIPTPAVDDTDGLGSTGQVVHPDVLYFANGWKGYKYWMIITGYYKSQDITENPYLFCSNDGIN
jgi:hypothetical protein